MIYDIYIYVYICIYLCVSVCVRACVCVYSLVANRRGGWKVFQILIAWGGGEGDFPKL